MFINWIGTSVVKRDIESKMDFFVLVAPALLVILFSINQSIDCIFVAWSKDKEEILLSNEKNSDQGAASKPFRFSSQAATHKTIPT